MQTAVVYVHGLWMTGVEGVVLRRRLAREQHPMDVLRRKPSRTPHDNVLAVLIPFQDRAGAYAKLLTDTGGDRNLPLRRDLRVSECHGLILPR